MAEQTLYETRAAAAWIELDRREKRNALTPAMVGEIRRHLEVASGDDGVRAVVITGRGKAFCAGADLEKGQGLADGSRRGTHPFASMLQEIQSFPKPVIAAVNGPAFGGGLGLMAAADIVIARSGVRFSFSEVKLGLIPAMISVVVLPRIGAHHARWLFLTGRKFGADEALSYGLVHRVVPEGELHRAVEEEVAEIGEGGPLAVAAAKRLIREVESLDQNEAFRRASAWFREVSESEEGREGMAAFVEKRLPRWRS